MKKELNVYFVVEKNTPAIAAQKWNNHSDRKLLSDSHDMSEKIMVAHQSLFEASLGINSTSFVHTHFAGPCFGCWSFFVCFFCFFAIAPLPSRFDGAKERGVTSMVPLSDGGWREGEGGAVYQQSSRCERMPVNDGSQRFRAAAGNMTFASRCVWCGSRCFKARKAGGLSDRQHEWKQKNQRLRGWSQCKAGGVVASCALCDITGFRALLDWWQQSRLHDTEPFINIMTRLHFGQKI